MICFRDMTFCSAACASVHCRRNWTPQQQQAARQWWSQEPDNAPVVFADFSFGCADYRPTDCPKEMTA